jgi:MFS family permease
VTAKPVPERRILGVTATVFALGVVSFLMDASSEMLVPIMPLFITSVLHAPATVVGVIEGLAETTASLLKAVSGRLSDRGARRPWILAGYGLGALSRPFMASAGSWLVLLAARLMDRTGKGFRGAPRDAMIASSTPKSELGRAFGVHRSMDTLGAAVGPLIAFLALPALNYRGVIWLSLIPAVLCVLVIVFFLRESKTEIAARRATERVPFPKDARLILFLVSIGVFAIGNSSDAFLFLRAADLGIPAGIVPLVYLAFNLVYAAAGIPAGLIADKLGRGRVARWGLVLFGLVYAGFGAARMSWQVWALFACYGVFMAFTEGVWKAYLGELAPENARGTVYGAFNAVLGLAALPASLIAGTLWDNVGHASPFYFGAVTATLASLALVLVRPRRAG